MARIATFVLVSSLPDVLPATSSLQCSSVGGHQCLSVRLGQCNTRHASFAVDSTAVTVHTQSAGEAVCCRRVASPRCLRHLSLELSVYRSQSHLALPSLLSSSLLALVCYSELVFVLGDPVVVDCHHRCSLHFGDTFFFSSLTLITS